MTDQTPLSDYVMNSTITNKIHAFYHKICPFNFLLIHFLGFNAKLELQMESVYQKKMDKPKINNNNDNDTS
jgi:hypothetical protein